MDWRSDHHAPLGYPLAPRAGYTRLAWLDDGVDIRVNAKAAQCFILPLAPRAVNALVFVARLMVFAGGVGRLCADTHIEAARNPHEWLKYHSCTVSAFILNAFTWGESVNHTIQAHLVTPLLCALLSLGPTVDKAVDK